MKRWVTVGLLTLYVAVHVSAQESNILARFEGAIGVGPIANVVLSPNSRWTEQGVSPTVAAASASPAPIAGNHLSFSFVGARLNARHEAAFDEHVGGTPVAPRVFMRDGRTTSTIALGANPDPAAPRSGELFSPALEAFSSVSTRAVAQTLPSRQTFPLADTNGLLARGLTMDTAEFLGRKAVRLVKRRGEGVDGFLPLPGVNFQDGTIEADVAVKITTQPGRPSPGFIGIAFRARPDASSYDMFYVRPGAAQADDQATRNQVAQYCAAPGYDWYGLRRAWPWVYEAHADLHLDAWTHMKIEVAGRTAKLYLNRNPEPSLVVDGLKGLDLHGGVSLFTFVDQEGYFSNVRITHVAPKPIKNGSDAAGTWDVKLSTDAGNFDGTLQLQRDGNKLSGTWSGALGQNREVTGTWRDGYVEL